jgi:hypothetical protein
MRPPVVFALVSAFYCADVTDVLAADLPNQFIAPVISAPLDAVNWTGVFVGAHAGGAWDQTGGYSTFPCPCTSANGSLLEQQAACKSDIITRSVPRLLGWKANLTVRPCAAVTPPSMESTT